MINECYVFKTYTRDQLVALIHDMANALPSELITNNAPPFIIRINGSVNGGKSLFWDEIKNSLLGMNTEKSPPSQNRHHEIWTGEHVKTKGYLKILFSNMRINEDFEKEKKALRVFLRQRFFSNKIENSGYSAELGNLLLLSNHFPSQHYKPSCDLSIQLTTKNLNSDWGRDIELSIHSPALRDSSEFQMFLKNSKALLPEFP